MQRGVPKRSLADATSSTSNISISPKMNLSIQKSDQGRQDASPDLTESNNLHRLVNIIVLLLYRVGSHSDLFI